MPDNIFPGESRSARDFRRFARFRRITCWLALTVVAGSGPVDAQPLIPFEDASLARRLASVEDLLEAREWDRAIDLLEATVTSSRERVVAVGENHYLNGSEAARVKLTLLPADALAHYRARKETQAANWLSAAKAQRDPRMLEELVEETFLTRAAEQALLLLGEWAFQSGDFAQARHWWIMLVPLEIIPGRSVNLVRFPDPETATADVLARLILCSILERDRSRAAWELQVFQSRFPEARGTLAGREGTWSKLLSEFAEQQLPPTSPHQPPGAEMLSVGRPLWQAPHDPDAPAEAPAVLPAISGDLILWNTHREVYAARLDSGQPAWIENPPRTPENWFRLSRLFPPGPRLGVESPRSPIVGAVTSRIAIHEGRAYFRSGGPVSAYSPLESRESSSLLSCLDLVEGEGLLRWTVEAEALANRLRFAGPPALHADRVYILGRRGLFPSELHLICLDANDGEVLWSQFVCSNSPRIREGVNLAECLELTAAGDRIMIPTKLGCLACFSLHDGRPLWYRAYPRRGESEWIDPLPGSTEQTLVHENLVLAAPADARELYALDRGSGESIWSRPARNGEQVLAAFDSCLLTVGNELICRHLADGHVRWKFSPTTPESRLAGRAMLHGDQVWWPTRREILVFHRLTGRMSRRIPLGERDALHGGNLQTDGTRLIVSDAGRVTVFSPYGLAPRDRARSPQ
jgi:outer membrane protein assembly factor BamB